MHLTHAIPFVFGLLVAGGVYASDASSSSTSEASCKSTSGTCRVLEMVDPGLRGERLRRVTIELFDWEGEAGQISVVFPSGASTQWDIQAMEDMPEENCSSACLNDDSIKCSTPNVDSGSHFCGGTAYNIMCTWIAPGFGVYSVELQCY